MKRVFRVIMIAVLLMPLLAACSSNVRTGAVESSDGTSWYLSYQSLSGREEKSFSLDADKIYTVTVDVGTEEGALALYLTGDDDAELYSGTDIPTGSFEVEAEGTAKLTAVAEAEGHKGHFSIEIAEKGN